MAHQLGPIFITGRVGDLCFYKSGPDYLVRTKGGPSREQVLRSPGFARVRENFTEFGACSRSARLFRQAVRAYLRVHDTGMHLRLTKLFTALARLDTGAPRGQRTVMSALQYPQTREWLQGFDFNAAAPLSKALLKPCCVTEHGAVIIRDLAPSTHLSAPVGTTDVTFSALMVSPCHDNVKPVTICYNTVTRPLNDIACDVVLQPASAGMVLGPCIYLLQVSFHQNINGVLRDIDPGRNSLSVISVMKSRHATRKRARTFAPTNTIAGLDILSRPLQPFLPTGVVKKHPGQLSGAYNDST